MTLVRGLSPAVDRPGRGSLLPYFPTSLLPYFPTSLLPYFPTSLLALQHLLDGRRELFQ